MSGLKSIVLLVLVGLCLAVFAFQTLPWLSTLPTVKARIDFNQKHNINGGATFYTDQPFLVELIAKQECKNQSTRNTP